MIAYDVRIYFGKYEIFYCTVRIYFMYGVTRLCGRFHTVGNKVLIC